MVTWLRRSIWSQAALCSRSRPCARPYLAQHTLSYLFSARPQERAEYFRTLLEVNDLEELRQTVASLEPEVKPIDTPIWTQFSGACAVPELVRLIGPFLTQVPATSALTVAFDSSAETLITAAEVPVPPTYPERLTTVGKILAERKALVLPLQALDRKPLPTLSKPATAVWQHLVAYLVERAKVDEETRRLTALFKEALNLPSISTATDPIDCPLCGTTAALTPVQIAHIRARVAETDDYRASEAQATAALGTLRTMAQTTIEYIKAASPSFLAATPSFRRTMGFTLPRVRYVAGNDAGTALVEAWLRQLRPLMRCRRKSPARPQRPVCRARWYHARNIIRRNGA